MLKTIILVCLVCCFGLGFGFQNYDKKHSGSAHHAVMHAEHWATHHVSAPHKKHHKYPKRHHPDKSTHHAAIHAEHWVNHHVSPPHKHQ
jgi:hypothetical protein